ncbi:hypothetical protein D3C73_1043710 [compost metagenome]
MAQGGGTDPNLYASSIKALMASNCEKVDKVCEVGAAYIHEASQLGFGMEARPATTSEDSTVHIDVYLMSVSHQIVSLYSSVGRSLVNAWDNEDSDQDHRVDSHGYQQK